MRKLDISMLILLTHVVDYQSVRGVGQSLFASLSQLKLLWQNDIDVVKNMETLLNDTAYKPLTRYQLYRATFTGIEI